MKQIVINSTHISQTSSGRTVLWLTLPMASLNTGFPKQANQNMNYYYAVTQRADAAGARTRACYV